MKKIHLILCLFLFIAQQASAQKTAFFSTSYLQECWWNESTNKYDNCTGADKSTLFKLNADQTMFYHTTESISSAYYVNSKEYDEDNDVYTYDVDSDVGNHYYFVVDLKNEQIRIVGNNKQSNSQTYMMVYTIKKSWTD